MKYKNPEQIIKQCNQEIKRNQAKLKTYIGIEDMVNQEVARLEQIKAVAEKQIIEEQGK